MCVPGFLGKSHGFPDKHHYYTYSLRFQRNFPKNQHVWPFHWPGGKGKGGSAGGVETGSPMKHGLR